MNYKEILNRLTIRVVRGNLAYIIKDKDLESEKAIFVRESRNLTDEESERLFTDVLEWIYNKNGKSDMNLKIEIGDDEVEVSIKKLHVCGTEPYGYFTTQDMKQEET